MAVANSARRTRIIRASLLAIVFSAALPATAQRAAPPKQDPSFLVERGRAGVFELGMTVDEVQAIAGLNNTKLIATYGEGMFQPELEIRLPGFAALPALTAPISDFPCGAPSVRGLLVRDPRFKTARGIGVGSTLADIRKYQPGAKIGNFGADGFPVVVDAESGVSFAFGDADESRDSERVTSLWIHGGRDVHARRCPGDREWAAVYQAVLDSVVIPNYRRFTGPPLVVIADTTHRCDAGLKRIEGVGCFDRTRTTAPFLTGKLADDFFGRNSGRYQVPLLRGVSALVAAAELPRMFPPAARPPSIEQYFRVSFSSPGFDNGRAAVYVTYSCGSLCGEGILVLLELRDDKWQVTSTRPLWVS